VTLGIDVCVAVPGRARVGEGPFWDAPSGTLSWVDIPAGTIHTVAPDGVGEPEVLAVPTLVGAAVRRATGVGFVAATSEGFAEVGPDGTLTTRLDFLPAGRRMNDAKCDPAGRLWAGSTEMDFAAGCGALHVLLPDWQRVDLLDGLALPNGLGWSPDGSTFYLVDSIARELNAFDVPADGPGLANRRVLARFTGSGLPDGLTVDAVGCLWVALWGGGRLVRLSPDGEVLLELGLPVEQPSSCTFGGAMLDVLYVTTAREGLALDADDPAGSVFAVRGLGVGGRPGIRFAG
jgi:sugar lactone lactonase YvrE